MPISLAGLGKEAKKINKGQGREEVRGSLTQRYKPLHCEILRTFLSKKGKKWVLYFSDRINFSFVPP